MTALALGEIGQIARPVKDIEAARRWYGDVLGLTHLYSFGTLAFYQCGSVAEYRLSCACLVNDLYTSQRVRLRD